MIATFDFQPGCILAGKYEVLACLGRGWESEVYKIRELNTRIERAAKIFFPHRNPNNRSAVVYAKKLHKLRSCPLLVQYHTFEKIPYNGTPLTAFISEYVEGELLADYLARLPGRRLTVFKGIHLLHGLAAGIESIHALGEYHGDLHAENVMVQRLGLTFELRLLDLFNRGRPPVKTARTISAAASVFSTTPWADASAMPSSPGRSRRSAAVSNAL